LPPEAIGNHLAYLEAVLAVELMHRSPALPGNPDDDPILQTALMGGADVLCTWDIDFREAARHGGVHGGNDPVNMPPRR
jgi:hypothetical protein